MCQRKIIFSQYKKYDLFLKIVLESNFIHNKLNKRSWEVFFFSIYLRLLPNIKKWDDFIENASWKMTYFLENIVSGAATSFDDFNSWFALNHEKT